MIRYLLSSGGAGMKEYILYTLLTLPIILLSLTVHECAHGWVAMKCGDKTAYNLGRLTLNPVKHIDPIGFLCMIFCGFGWAKPVPINTRYFKKPRRDMALTAAAGPAANLVFAFFFALLERITEAVLSNAGIANERLYYFLYVLGLFFYIGARLNTYLAVFNLLPIPPFDGSRIFFIFLPVKWYFGIMKYERIIQIVLLVLLWTGFLTTPLDYLAGLVLNGMYGLLGLIPFF